MAAMRATGLDIRWEAADGTRVPFEVFWDADLYELELARVFGGAHWQYLALEEEIAAPGDYATTWLGERQVVVARGLDGQIGAFENRCAHRGAQVVTRLRGNTRQFNCPYHMWCYDHQGNLTAVPQQNGIKGKGGMPADFARAGRGMRKLRTACYRGLVFGTFAEEIAPLEDYLGAHALAQIDRITARPLRRLGYFRQMVAANWKLYAENTRDPYHAPLLHLFHVSFGIQTPAMKGGIVLGGEGQHNCILAVADPQDAQDHALLSEQYSTNDKYRPDFKLKDPRLVRTRRSFEDGITTMILSIFPSLVIAQVDNAFQIRHVRPKGPDRFEIYWTYFGFADADEGEHADKLLLANMIGPAGFISMEDGEAARLVQKAARTQRGDSAFIEMGGRDKPADQDHLVTEAAIRGFWQYYRKTMGFDRQAAGRGNGAE